MYVCHEVRPKTEWLRAHLEATAVEHELHHAVNLAHALDAPAHLLRLAGVLRADDRYS